jgi:hypothetical protein
MLYQAGIIILRQTENAVVIPYLSFPFSWMEFTGLLNQNQKDESEEASTWMSQSALFCLKNLLSRGKYW